MMSDWLNRLRKHFPGVVVIVLAIYFVWRPLDDLFLNGIYSWHMGTSAVREGGLELVTLYLILLGAVPQSRRTKRLLHAFAGIR